MNYYHVFLKRTLSVDKVLKQNFFVSARDEGEAISKVRALLDLDNYWDNPNTDDQFKVKLATDRGNGIYSMI